MTPIIIVLSLAVVALMFGMGVMLFMMFRMQQRLLEKQTSPQVKTESVDTESPSTVSGQIIDKIAEKTTNKIPLAKPTEKQKITHQGPGAQGHPVGTYFQNVTWEQAKASPKTEQTVQQVGLETNIPLENNTEQFQPTLPPNESPVVIKENNLSGDQPHPLIQSTGTFFGQTNWEGTIQISDNSPPSLPPIPSTDQAVKKDSKAMGQTTGTFFQSVSWDMQNQKAKEPVLTAVSVDKEVETSDADTFFEGVSW